MKVIGLSGESGTGKSYNAMELCSKMNIEAMIDDGLLIYENRIVEGISAKKQPTKIGAVKTALFTNEEHCQSVKRAIRKLEPNSLLVVGTSHKMIEQIVTRLKLPMPTRVIHIEDITSPGQRIKARKFRVESGTHIIPAPTFQVKRQFSGYFLNPMKRFRGGIGSSRTITTEKTVVRPTYSYLGEYEISNKVLTDIVNHIVRLSNGNDNALWVTANNDSEMGLYIRIILLLEHGKKVRKTALAIQKGVHDAVDYMTAFNVQSVDVEIRGLKKKISSK